MKTKNRILTVISTIAVAIIVLSQTSFAKTFTPARDEFQFPADGTAGLSYNTFNNFSGNNAIEDAPRFGHEREFTTVTKCEDKVNDLACELGKTADGKIIGEADEWMNMQDGDIMEFGIYFHNNGEDPYDGAIPGPATDTQGVEIGIDFTDPYAPTGFIYSRDSVYKKSGKTVNYQASDYWHETDGGTGKTVRTISDNVLLHSYSPITIEILPELTNLYMAYDHDNNNTLDTYYYNFVPTIEKPGTINTKVVTTNHNENVTGASTFKNFPIKVYRTYDQAENKVYLHFDKIPGCLRYAGFAYFRAKIHVEQPETLNYCTSLTLTKQTQQTCNPNEKFTVFSAKVNFTDENVPTEQYITFDSTDKKAKLTLYPPNQGTITEFPSKPQKVIGKFIAAAYDGLGTIKATYTDAQGKPIEGLVEEEGTGNIYPGFCTGSIPTCTDDCVNICVQHPVDIPAGSLSEFSAEATGYYGDTWSGQIQYLVEKGKGKFYKGKKSEVIAQIKEDFPGANPYENPNANLGCVDLTNIIITPQNILNLINDTFAPKNEVNFTPDQTLPQYNFIKPTEGTPTGDDPIQIDTRKFTNNVLMALDFKTYQPKAQDINLKTDLDISTSTGNQNLKTVDQGDIKGSLDLNDLNIDVSQDYTTPDMIDLPEGKFTLPSNNDEPLLPMGVIAAENEDVWFYAAEEGDNSITVSATGTSNPDCSQKFDTSPLSLCQSMTVSAYDKKSAVNKGNLPCINEGQMVGFTIDEATTTNGKKLDFNKDKISTIWTTTDPLGKFENGLKTLNTNSQSVTYTGKGDVKCKVTSINGVTDANSLCTYGIATCPKVIEKCGKLDLKFNETPVKPTTSDKITTVDKTKEAKGAEMTLAVASDKNADYPSYVVWEDTTEGELTFKNPQHVQKLPDSFMTKVVGGVETVVTIKNYSAKYPEAGIPTLKNAKHEGTVTAKVQGEELICAATLSVIEVVEAKVTNVCRALTYQVQRMGDPASTWASNQSTLPNTENYLIKNTVTYSPDIDESLKFVDYKTTKGYFSKAVKIGEKPGATELKPWLVNALSGVMLPAGDVGWVQELKGVPAGKQVIFVPDKTLAPGPYPQAVEITASNSSQLTEPGCTKYIRLVVPESARACQNITLNAEPTTWWNTPPLAPLKTKFWLTGDVGNYTGNFSFTLTKNNSNAGLLYEEKYGAIKMDIAYLSKEQAFDSSKGIYLVSADLSTTWSVFVKASDEEITACKAELKYAPPTTPPPGGQTVCSSLDITKPKSWVIDEDDDQEFEVSVQPTNYPWTIKWEVTGGGNAYFDKGKTTVGGYTNELKNISDKPKVKVYVEGYQTQCHDEIEASIVSENETPPSMKKKVAKGEMDDIDSDDWEDIINVSGKTLGKKSQPDQFITYKIEYKNGHNKGIESVLIKDQSMKDGEIESKGDLGGTLKFVDMTIEVGGDEIDKDEICEYKKVSKNGDIKLDPAKTKTCVTTKKQADTDDEDLDVNWDDIEKSFANDKGIDSEGLVFNRLKNDTKITILYQMENKTALSDNTCKTLLAEDGCGEEFKNEASFEAYEGDNAQGHPAEYDDTDSTKVIAVCPYILTRASGDVFFESTLETGAGIDVAYCSKQKNIQAPIITPIPEEKLNLSVTGTPGSTTTLTLPSHDICKYSNVTQEQAEENGKDPNPEGYQNPFTSFSSTICEMKAEVAKDWMKKNVVDQISTNVEKVSLWAPAQRNLTISSMQDLAASTNGILRWNDSLTINGSHNTYAINKNPTPSIPAAQTYIIMNADLNINSNIVYGSNTSTSSDLKSYPSAAFIVINGNINIAPDVTQLDGTYIAIDTDETDDKDTGKVLSNNVSYSQLTINGSLIGDVSNLFENRKYVGNVAADEGSVTIKYNENFLLNPPPGLNQLMDIKQLEVAY